MRIDQLLAAGPTRSFEYFPPKSDEESQTLLTTLHELAPLHPSFVSVTYRGGRESRQRTFDLVSAISDAGETTAMAHLICVGHTKQEMREILSMYRDAGLQNIMALGGDISDDPTLVASEFTHAIELVELAKEVGDFSVGVAAHPLGHPRSTSMEEDRRFLAEKLAIADFAVTQFFFSAQEWEALVRDLADLGCTKPIVPGIMPVTTLSGAQRMAAMGAAVPESLMADLESCADASAVRALGIQRATELCRDLLEAGAPGLHFYTLNRSTATRDMCAALQA